MNADELFRAGRLRDAIEAQILEVKTHPTDSAKRLFLFEMYVFEGDLDHARRQADALRFDDPELHASFLTYRSLLDAEVERRAVFHEGVSPRFLADPPAHVALRLEALARLRAGDSAAASALLSKANEEAPAFKAMLDGKEVDALRDIDDLFGTVLEVMAKGHYFWVPLEQVERLAMNPPRFPRDLLWIPAKLELEEATGDVFLPALYPSSHEHNDELIKLGRQTDWSSDETGASLGAGLHTYLAGDDAIGLLEWREYSGETPPQPPATGEAEPRPTPAPGENP